MANQNKLSVSKSELLFLYESTYSVPNGDPFTGEQRYDEETKKILVSDVRIKRFIRDHFLERGDHEVYVFNDRSSVESGKKMTGAEARVHSLRKKFDGGSSSKLSPAELLQKCIDVRLFGGISTEKKHAVNLTGPVQFAMLNPSKNAVDLRMHQNTSVFSSSTEKERGAIGTTTVVPYALNQIHGWVNPYSAVQTGLSEADLSEMFRALWHSINNANTRTKQNQNAVLLLRIVYADPNKKLYGADRLIKISSKKASEEQIRSMDDFDFDFSELKARISDEIVQEVQFYTEVESIKSELTGSKFKFKAL